MTENDSHHVDLVQGPTKPNCKTTTLGAECLEENSGEKIYFVTGNDQERYLEKRTHVYRGAKEFNMMIAAITKLIVY